MCSGRAPACGEGGESGRRCCDRTRLRGPGSTRGRDDQHIRLVAKRGNKAEIVIGHRPLRHQHDLARTIEVMRQGGQRRLTWNDRRGADEMHRGRDLARTFEAWHGQLHIGVGELDDGMEKRRRSRTDIKAAQLLVQTKERRLTIPWIVLMSSDATKSAAGRSPPAENGCEWKIRRTPAMNPRPLEAKYRF